jgi:DNA helicase-2/ATP-dependent DNA helicase PcrA
MSTKAFTDAYKKLNTDQKRAVDTIEGPVMVIAGPGTGKTTVLTLRIANILQKTDTAPEQILALTFTESGVYSMRKNLMRIIGGSAYRVGIHTFHEFCNEVIRTHPEAFSHLVGARHIDTLDQIQLLEGLIRTLPLKVLRPKGDMFYYVYPLLRKIGELKKDAITPTEFVRFIDREKKGIEEDAEAYHVGGKRAGELKAPYKKRLEQLARAREAALVYRSYQTKLRTENLYDYEDMVMEVLSALEKNKKLLLSLQEEYQYVLADEHQDVNRAQNKLLELLSAFHAPFPNLFIVGDEKQAIFRFQGASLDNFLYFKKLYPKSTLITLATNYRSTQTILNATGSLMENSTALLPESARALTSSHKRQGNALQVIACASDEAERAYIINAIQEAITKEHIAPGEIAVLYRDNKDATPLIEALSKTRIPFVVESEQNILEALFVRKLLALMEALAHYGNPAYVIPVLHLDVLALPPLAVYKVITYSEKQKLNIYDVIESAKHLRAAKVSDTKPFLHAARMLRALAVSGKNDPLPLFLERVLYESGFLKILTRDETQPQVLETIDRFFDEVKKTAEGHPDYRLKDFMEYLELLVRYGIGISSRKDPFLLEAVHLMTAHRSKGLEFRRVFVIGAYDKHWGGRSGRDLFPVTYLPNVTEGDDDDERRLFYVALTRAKEQVTITYAHKDKDGKERLASRFIEEIRNPYREHIFYAGNPQKNEVLATRIQPRANTGVPILEKQFLNELFEKRGFSVTGLNNYLECPWRYFYVNLLRIPQAEAPHLMYGTAVHEALKILFDRRRAGYDVKKKEVLSFFVETLKQFPLDTSRFEHLKTRGENALSGYFDSYKKEFAPHTWTEYPIRGVRLAEGVILNGKLDKIEFVEGGVNVVDYKTGNPKSRNELEGKTKQASGNEKRQLIFYKLLLDLFNKKELVFFSGELDFIEPDAHGKYHKELFFITEEETRELKELILSVSTEIRDLSFWDKRCDEKDCRYCQLRNEWQFAKAPHKRKGKRP